MFHQTEFRLSSVAGIKLFLYPDSLSHDPILQDKSF